MHDAAHLGRVLRLQQRQEVVVGLPAVEEDRLPDRAREGDLISTRVDLPRAGGEVPVVVETDLPHGHHLRRRGERRQLGQRPVVGGNRIVGMDADGRVDVGMRLGQRDRLARGDEVGPDGQEQPLDPIEPGVARMRLGDLAVGLEHLGQNRLALDFYRKALDLSFKKGHANFDQSLVIQRVGQLSTRVEQ